MCINWGIGKAKKTISGSSAVVIVVQMNTKIVQSIGVQTFFLHFFHFNSLMQRMESGMGRG